MSERTGDNVVQPCEAAGRQFDGPVSRGRLAEARRESDSVLLKHFPFRADVRGAPA